MKRGTLICCIVLVTICCKIFEPKAYARLPFAVAEESVTCKVPDDTMCIEIFEDTILGVDIVDEEEMIYNTVDEQPEFPGGMKALAKYLKENMNYPEKSRKHGSQGCSYVVFIINADGSITDVQTMRSAGDVYIDMEAHRLVENMPKWIPAKKDGKNVRVRFTLPIMFRLQEKE